MEFCRFLKLNKNSLQSPRVLAICDNKAYIPQQILEFVTRHVIPHEDYCAFYHRKFVCHFDEFNNCSHAGTNNGVKSGAAAVLPGHDISSGGKRLHFQGTQLKSSSKTNINFEQKALFGCIVNYEVHNVEQVLETKNFNGYNCQTHLAVNYEHIELFQNNWDAPCQKISSGEKL